MMLSYIPAIIGVTLVISYAATSLLDQQTDDISLVLADNMFRHHMAAVETAAASGATSGVVAGVDVAPFRNMGDWRSEAFTAGAVTIVATWSTPYSTPTGEPPDFESHHYAKAAMSLSETVGSETLLGFAGLLSYNEARTSVSLSGFDITDFDVPVRDKTPMAISVLSQ